MQWYIELIYHGPLSYGSISGKFGRAKIPMTRPHEPDMQSKRTKKVRLGTVFIIPKFSQKSGYIYHSVEAMLARYVLQIVLTWSSTLLLSSSFAFFPLVCLEFHSLNFQNQN